MTANDSLYEKYNQQEDLCSCGGILNFEPKLSTEQNCAVLKCEDCNKIYYDKKSL